MIVLADKIAKSFGGQVLYSQATLQLNAGERWALVGPNGAGKTTLLRIIMGLESADEGTVSFARGTTLGYLEQETKLAGEKSALQEIEEKYGLKTTAIVTMAEVVEHLYNRPYKGKVVIDDQLKAAIDAYYEIYGAK